MIEVLTETGSTNADLIARLRHGDPVAEGDWLVADRQISGRGRQGRVWTDGSGNFMGSTCVRLRDSDPVASTLSLVASLALFDTVLPNISQIAALQLKWPNDLLLRGAKLAGILLERDRVNVVVGFGVNLAKAPQIEGRRTVALSELGPALDRDQFAVVLSKNFAERLAQWRAGGAIATIATWTGAAHPRGTVLKVHDANGAAVEGRFDGLEGDGAMRLRLVDGSMRVIHTGDVTLEGD